MSIANEQGNNVSIYDIGLAVGTGIRNRYTIKNHISFGNTTILYIAEDNELKKTVLLKELCPYRLVNRDMDGKTLVLKGNRDKKTYKMIEASFINEIKILKKLGNHKELSGKVPGYVADFNENNTLYLVIEYLEGCDLKQKIQSGETLSFRKTAYELVSIVHKIHKFGVLHRDIKLSNMFIKKDGTLALLDFGSACLTEEESETMKYASNGYSAPEMYEKGSSTLYADIYSIGAVMYQMLTGILPNRADLRTEGDLADITEYINIPWPLANCIMKSLEFNPEKRLKHLSLFKLLL